MFGYSGLGQSNWFPTVRRACFNASTAVPGPRLADERESRTGVAEVALEVAPKSGCVYVGGDMGVSVVDDSRDVVAKRAELPT